MSIEQMLKFGKSNNCLFRTMLLAIKSFFLSLLVTLGLCEPVPTVVLTFDAYPTTYTAAYPIMRKRGLVGTYFVDVNYVDRDISNEPESEGLVITTQQLKELQANGWDIQGYTGATMAKFLKSEGREATRRKFADMQTTMARKGFKITSLAAASRVWNEDLKEIAAPMYKAVRANNNINDWQKYPIKDAMWIKEGGSLSLSGADTVAALGKQLGSVIANKGAWFIVVHKVGDKNDPALSINSDTFAAFCDLLAAQQKAGKIRVVTFENALVQENRWKLIN